MRKILLVVIGIAAALAGLVWTLQGLGYVGGSFMSGATVWAVIGPLVALAGLALIVVGLRTSHRARRLQSVITARQNYYATQSPHHTGLGKVAGQLAIFLAG